MRFPTLLLTMLVLAAAALTACGKDSAPAASAAASLAPTDAVVYGEVALDPDDDSEQGLERLLAKFPGGDEVGGKLERLTEQAFEEGSDASFSYDEDIKPWLGDEAAFFVAGFGADDEPHDIAVLIATDDEQQALDAVKKSEPKTDTGSFRGHDYLSFDADGDQLVAGVLDGWLTIGTLDGFKAAVGASEGDGLAGTDRYERAVEEATDERLGLVYVDMRGLADLIARQPGGAQVLQSLNGLADAPFVMTLAADAEGAEIATSLPESASSFLGPFVGEGGALVGDAPADAWLAIGQPQLGKTLDQVVDQFAGEAGGRGQIESQLRAATGLTIDELIGWMGDYSLFVRGEAVAELDGALVVETNDESASAKTLQALERLARNADDDTRVLPLDLPGEGFKLGSSELPQPLYVYQRDGRVVIAFGEQAAKDALEPSERLTDSSDYKQAVDSLGDDYDVSAWIAVAPILKLIDSTPVAGEEEWAQAKPYLDPLGALISGAKKEDSRLSSVLRITVP